MSFRLRNQNNPEITLGLNNQTWYGILEMAEEHGWNPMGTVLPEWQYGMIGLGGFDFEYLDQFQGEYWPDENRLVLLEDALNLAGALERAEHFYQPQSLPSLRVYSLLSDLFNSNRSQPSIGAIRAMIDFCYPGAFFIEKF
jgi:hypothetical protein